MIYMKNINKFLKIKSKKLYAIRYTLYASRGFTLIEVLVVVAIIGLLAGVVLSGVGDTFGRSRDARRVLDLNQIQLALQVYSVKNGSYPVQKCVPNDFLGDCMAPLKTALGVNRLPQDSKTGQTYLYSSDGSTYTLAAKLEAADPTKPPLKDSAQGNLNDIPCVATNLVYCVTF